MNSTFIYRITHYRNLPFILQNGIHCQNSNINDPNFIQIGFPSLIDKRNERQVPIEPSGTLADYVPFYFTVRSPMLYVIAMGNDPEVIKTPQEDIIYIVSSVEKLEGMKIKYVFTNRHAKLDYAQFYNKYADLKKLNWDIIESNKWGRQYGTERKEIKQAECLVYKHLPVTAIMGIGCKTEKMYNIINDMIERPSQDFFVTIKPEWYFEP
ncbi:hypothetical protein JZK55_19920 [Dissulfurispira thermophila]|uniref:DarT domain-containing protein n=1 Tax=Dissulfurispira thermophila TaxID=2715679 RepID=A0A7G1H2R3_9BACT|nr:DUF4433 domain-containing protein [Dissulfurispira thermophila]BCB97070.1 hypothetical protein JZK55_19920 [Dissulfurispira thermophila]